MRSLKSFSPNQFGEKLCFSKTDRYFKFSKTQKKTNFLFIFIYIYIYFPKIDSYDNKNDKFKLQFIHDDLKIN